MTEQEIWNMWHTCITIACKYHKGQIDKVGVPYIEHPKRVGDTCFNELCNIDYSDDETIEFARKCQCIGYLHDVLEDTDCTVDILREEGVPKDVIDGVISVTRIDTESYEDFVQRAAKNKYGRFVKFYDLIDNLDIKRFAGIKELTADDLSRLNKYLKWYNWLYKHLYD